MADPTGAVKGNGHSGAEGFFCRGSDLLLIAGNLSKRRRSFVAVLWFIYVALQFQVEFQARCKDMYGTTVYQCVFIRQIIL